MVRRGARDLDLEMFWQKAIERQRSSGLTVRQFCKSERLKDYTFWYWGRELRKRERAAKASTSSRNRTRQSSNGQDQDQNWRAGHHVSVLPRKDKKEEKFWSAILEEWQRSGLSLKKFAPVRMVGYKTLCRWRRKLLPETLNEPENGFAPVRLIGEQEELTAVQKNDGAKSIVEIVLKCGRLIRVSTECPLDFLSAVVSAVERS